MGEYTYKVTSGEMEALYAQMGTTGMGSQVAGNAALQDSGTGEAHKSTWHKLLDDIKDRNHSEQGHPQD